MRVFLVVLQAVGRLLPGGPLVVYRTARFEAACRLIGGWRSKTRLRVALSVFRHPRRLVLVWALLRLPVADVHVSRAEYRSWRSSPYPPATRCIFDGFVAQAALPLTTDGTYLSGRRRRNLRRNLRRAGELGMVGVRPGSYDEWLPMASEVLSLRPGGAAVIAAMRAPAPSHRVRYFAVTSRSGAALAFAGVACFGTTAVLFSSLIRPDHGAFNPARYLLHELVRSTMAEEGMSLLLAGSGLALSPGLQYFQNVLGYGLRTVAVHLDRPDRPAGRVACRGSRRPPRDRVPALRPDRGTGPHPDRRHGR